MKAEIKTQVCTKCGLEKPLSEYSFRNDTQKHRRDCKGCMRSRNKKYYRANPEKILAQNKAWQKANREKYNAILKAWAKANPEKIKACKKKWAENNVEKIKAYRKKWAENNVEKARAKKKAWAKANAEKVKAMRKAWQKNNPKKVRANTAKRKATKLQATPAWADLKKIEEIYLNCPPGYHVDHIFPLKSDKMCGLHVENNLQYLPAKENISKGNRVSLEEQLNG
jgi:hypothetical protein